MKQKVWRIAGVNFDHFHMGDLLRMAVEHPRVELVGISDEKPERMQEAIRKLGVRRERSFTDYRACLEQTKPDIVILCQSEEHTSELQSQSNLVCRLLLEKKKNNFAIAHRVQPPNFFTKLFLLEAYVPSM